MNWNEYLIPMLKKMSDTPCQFCGMRHSACLTTEGFVMVSEDSCARWNRHLKSMIDDMRKKRKEGLIEL